MPNRPLLKGAATVEVDQDRYDELVAAEERLYILEKAIQKLNFYHADFEIFKSLFDLNKKIKEAEPVTDEGKAPEGENA